LPQRSFPRERDGGELPVVESTEVEVKLLVDGRALPQLTALPVIGTSLKRAARRRIETSYYDTPEHILERQGLVLRVRKGDGNPLLSVKQHAGGAIIRKEWERRIRGDEPQPKDWRGTPVEPLLKQSDTRSLLRPLFTTVIDRAAFEVEYDGALIEVAFDRGEIKHDGRELPVSEIEFELKRGGREAPFSLARMLARHAPLRLGLLSKGERGQLLSSGCWGMPYAATTPEITETTSLRDAIQIICRTCLKDFARNETILAGRYDSEAVHQARIAVRRLRSALGLFKGQMTDPQRPILNREIKWLWGVTGPARDLDVMRGDLEEERERGDLPAGAASLIEVIENKADAARVELLAALRSDRNRLLFIDLAGWIENGEWSRSASAALGGALMASVGGPLDKKLEKLQRLSRKIGSAKPRKRHRIRIAAKELRLVCEFFDRVVTEGKARKRYDALLSVLGKLQKPLGRLQDRATQIELLEQAAQEAQSTLRVPSIPLDTAVTALASDRAKHPAKLLKSLKKSSEKLAKVKGFWQ
jgi:triphosphatase